MDLCVTSLTYPELPLAFKIDSNASEKLMKQGKSAKARKHLIQ